MEKHYPYDYYQIINEKILHLSENQFFSSYLLKETLLICTQVNIHSVNDSTF